MKDTEVEACFQEEKGMNISYITTMCQIFLFAFLLITFLIQSSLFFWAQQSQSHKSTPSFIDSYVYLSITCPFLQPTCVYICMHTHHTHQPQLLNRLQTVYMIEPDTVLSVPGSMSERAQNFPPLEPRERPLYLLKVRKWAGAAFLQSFECTGPSQSQDTDNTHTQKNPTKNSSCIL